MTHKASERKGGKWMQSATAEMKKGALRATAKREGLIKGKEKLSGADLNKLADSKKNPTTRKRATLAKTFAKARSK